MSRLARALAALLLVATAIVATGPPSSAAVDPTGPVAGSATGSTSPVTAVEPATVTNGDFTIAGLTTGSTVGDGVDEQTAWTIDMTADPDLASLPVSGSLEEATLLLTLTPGAASVTDDTVGIAGLADVNPAGALAGLQVGVTETVAVNLLEFYSEHELLDALDGNAGTLPMTYRSDAVVSFAEVVFLAAAEDEFFASDAGVSHLYGFSLAVDGNTAVVGAPGGAGSGEPGSAYVLTYDGSTWTEQAVLTADVPVADERFGYDVDIDNGVIAIGARDDGGSQAGAVYLFSGSGSSWTQDAVLTSGLGPTSNDQFGSSVHLDGNRLLVGAPTAGTAFLFENSGSGWSQSLSLVSPVGGNGLFGDTVLIDDDRLLVGAPIEAAGSLAFAGSVYVFDAVTGAQGQHIEPADRSAFHAFGTSLVVDGGTLAVGASSDSGPAGFDPTCTGSTATCNPGSVYLYSESGGTYTFDTEVHASDLDLEINVTPGAQFGLEVDLDGDTLLVGARYNDGRNASVGKAHVFERIDGTWTARNRFVASDSRQGDLLGSAVAIFGASADDFLVGAPLDDTVNGLATTNEGSVYVFGTSVTAPDILITPGSVDFGDVEVGLSGMTMVTVTNDGNRNLVISSLNLSGDPSVALVGPPSLPLTLEPQSVNPAAASVDLQLTFTPTVVGAVSATLSVGSNDPDGAGSTVAIVGEGVPEDDDPVAMIADLLAFYDTSLADGTLVPQGNGNSAANRAQALRNMLETASDLIENGESACDQLEAALAKTDGDPKPPDFVAGANAPELAQRIQDLLDSLGC